jgi:iron complex transport system substrate-binding protein
LRALLAGVLLAAAPATHTVVDMSGASVAVPVVINRIAEEFPAHTVTDIMLGVGDKLVAIPQNVKTIPLLRQVYPRITAIPELFRQGGNVNIEDLLARAPDIVSATDGRGAAGVLRAAGLPAVVMTFRTLKQLPASILLAGQVYGGPAADRAREYVDYLNARIALIAARTATLRPDQRPSVVHISGFPPLVVDGGPTLIDDWITLGGGTDAARDLAGVHVGITMEQLLAWNPDVLVIQTPGGDQGMAATTGQSVIAALAASPGWAQLKAVQTGRVALNPQGMYPWERFGPEEALQIQWIAKTLHPDLFADLDIRAEAAGFYRRFFGYTVADQELDRMLPR